MVETICLNCGNRKSFEDNLIGKTFKCPKCSKPVNIQNLGPRIDNETKFMNSSFADEIARAEQEAARLKSEKQINNYGIYAITSATIGFIILICRIYPLGIALLIYTCYQIYKIFNTKKNDRNYLP